LLPLKPSRQRSRQSWQNLVRRLDIPS
jgi:hypothetical protein